MSLGEFLGSWSGVTKGLYHLNGNANDSSWNWNNGTATNVSYVAGRLWSQCGSFNGSAYVNLSDVWFPSGNSARTISAWINFTTSWQISWSYWIYWGSYWRVFALSLSTNNIYIVWYWADTSITTTLSTWIWYHIVITYDWTTLIAFKNWVYVWQWTPSLNTTLDWSFKLGSYNHQTWGFQWLIDEGIIENRAWSASEVRKQYTYQKWRFWILS